MKFIDLFAGIGGMRRGLEIAGHECVGWCEWDKKDSCLEFKSCGLRYLENRKDGLEKFIMEFAKAEYYKRTGEMW